MLWLWELLVDGAIGIIDIFGSLSWDLKFIDFEISRLGIVVFLGEGFIFLPELSLWLRNFGIILHIYYLSNFKLYISSPSGLLKGDMVLVRCKAMNGMGK